MSRAYRRENRFGFVAGDLVPALPDKLTLSTIQILLKYKAKVTLTAPEMCDIVQYGSIFARFGTHFYQPGLRREEWTGSPIAFWL